MTPSELREWREGLGWSTRLAAEKLGIAERTYKYYEQGESSYGTPRPEVPLRIELAVAEVARREQSKINAAG